MVATPSRVTHIPPTPAPKKTLNTPQIHQDVSKFFGGLLQKSWKWKMDTLQVWVSIPSFYMSSFSIKTHREPNLRSFTGFGTGLCCWRRWQVITHVNSTSSIISAILRFPVGGFLQTGCQFNSVAETFDEN